ncbi:MAG: SGNH/GDSL hydrolase family protein [Sulfitobacter sp.]
MLLIRLCAALALIAMLAAPAAAERPMRVLVMGDSFMTTNASAKQSFPHALSDLLNTNVKSKATTGARHLYALPITGMLGMNISKQYRPGNWDYVVMNGGGNDLWMGCGCGKCTRVMNKLIASNGRKGAIPSTILRARRDGAKVIYVGYLRSPGRGSPIERCKPAGDTLEARIKKLAALDPGVTFVSLSDMVPHGDASFHAFDMVHPSPKGSAAAAKLVMSAIKSNPS